MISVQVNGTPYAEIIKATVTVSLETLANDFSFTASAVAGFPAIRQGDAVVIAVDGVKVLTGFIDEVSGSERGNEHSVVYSGRDRTGDLLDSQIDVIDEIKASDSLTLKSIIERVLAHLGSSVVVVDEFNPPPFNAAEDIVVPKVGQSAFGFITQYAAKRQALLTSNGDGDIVITQSRATDSGAVVQRLAGGQANNIITQSWTINASRLFNKYVSRGQLDPLALNASGGSTTTEIESQSGIVSDANVRVGRQSITVESKTYSDAQLTARAKWSQQLARAGATRFDCTVRGHAARAGEIWQPNTLVQVASDTADISRKMLLSTITYSQARGEPTVSALSFVERDVYTIDERIRAQRAAGGLNDVFKNLG